MLVACALLGIASIGQADGKVYPGLFCVDKNSSSDSMAFRYGGTSFVNEEAGNTVGCPVVRDVGSAADWEVTVNRDDATPTETWTLTLWSTNKSGTSGNFNTITVPNTNGILTLAGSSAAHHTEGGMLHIETIMPENARIYRYEVFE